MARLFRLHPSILDMVEDILNLLRIQTILIIYIYLKRRACLRRRVTHHGVRYSLIGWAPRQRMHMNRLVSISDVDCFSNLRMDRNAFGRLCILLKEQGGLRDCQFVLIEKQVAIF